MRAERLYMPADTMCWRRAASRTLPKRLLARLPTIVARSLMIERLSASSIRRVAKKPYCSIPATLWAARRRGATIARPMITRPAPSRARPATRKSIFASSLNLDVDDLLDDQGPAHDEQGGGDEQGPAAHPREQRMQVMRVQEHDHEQQADGQQGDDPARHPCLRRERRDEAAQLEALAHRLGDPIDDLGRGHTRVAL